MKSSIILYIIGTETAPNFVISNAFHDHFDPCYDFDWVNIASQVGLHAMHQQFIDILKAYRPDYCFMQLQDPSKMDVETIREMAKYTKIIHWTGDVRNSALWYEWMAAIGREVYITLFSNETDAEKLTAMGVHAGYLQVGFDNIYYQRRARINGWPDIVLVANDYDMFDLSTYRKDVVLAMYRAFPGQFRVFGVGWHKWGIATESISHTLEAECYNSCKIALSVSSFNYKRYHSDRLLRIMACGCFPLSHAYPDLEKDYTPGFDIETFAGYEELIEKCKYYLQNPEERVRIGTNAFVTAHTRCTWNVRCKELKEILSDCEEISEHQLSYLFTQNV
jgi:spore maturation protein CgeB